MEEQKKGIFSIDSQVVVVDSLNTFEGIIVGLEKDSYRGEIVAYFVRVKDASNNDVVKKFGTTLVFATESDAKGMLYQKLKELKEDTDIKQLNQIYVNAENTLNILKSTFGVLVGKGETIKPS